MEVIEEQTGSHSGSFESQSGGSPRQGAVAWGAGRVPAERSADSAAQEGDQVHLIAPMARRPLALCPASMRPSRRPDSAGLLWGQVSTRLMRRASRSVLHSRGP